MPGDNSEWAPPETIPNSAVKPFSADDSVRSPHVKVGHRQAPYTTKPPHRGFFYLKTAQDFVCARYLEYRVKVHLLRKVDFKMAFVKLKKHDNLLCQYTT